MITTKSDTYILPGNPVIDLPIERVGQLLFDERGEAVQAKLNERFRGITDIEDTHNYNQGEPILYSNTPRNIARAQILAQENDGEIQVLSPIQLVQYWNKLSREQGTYANTSAVSVFPKPHRNKDNETLRRRVLDLIGKDSSKLEIPLLVDGLDVDPDQDNSTYGFTFNESKFTPLVVTEASFLQKNQRVKYDETTNSIVPCEEDEGGIQICISGYQGGLLSANRDWDGGLDFRDDILIYSDLSGRVDVRQDPRGNAEFLDTVINQLEAEKSRLGEAQSKIAGTLNYLRTGKS